MANYQILKADIDEKIYENAQQKITGANLNSVLNKMVDSLGRGYQFGGLVFPADAFVPGDEKMAFVAATAGRYPSFGNYSIVDGEVALFIWEGSAWKKQVVSYYKNDQVYGVRHFFNNASPDLMRIGDSALHRDLPVHSTMRRCVVNTTGDVLYYLGANDSSKKADGSGADLTGTNTTNVMVEVAEHYRKCSLNAAGGYMDVEVSLFPFDGAIFVPRYLVSAFEATVDRENDMLASVVNKTARYRGGNNNADWDGTYKSLLGVPASYLSLTNFRDKARKLGADWGCYDWNIHTDIFWLYAIEYATLNTQKAFNGDLDAAGFHQGGLGAGVTTFNNWSAYNDYEPFIPCGHTLSLGNKTGVVSFTLTPEQAEAYGSEHTESVPSYRGIENPFGHLFEWTDGFLAKGTGEFQEIYISRDRKQYASTLNDSYVDMGHDAAANGYVKSILATMQILPQELRVYGDLIPTDDSASANTFYTDYHYTAHDVDVIYGAFLGGNAISGASAGLAYRYSNDSPAYAGENFGSRLCWQK